MAKLPTCRTCGSHQHYATFCFYTKKKPINQNTKHRQRLTDLRREWIKLNLPDKFGLYYCYLRIHPLCLVKMDVEQTTLDHVKPRSNRHELKYELSNLQPACSFCNNLKGSRSLESLSIDYPHLKSVIAEMELDSPTNAHA